MSARAGWEITSKKVTMKKVFSMTGVYQAPHRRASGGPGRPRVPSIDPANLPPFRR